MRTLAAATLLISLTTIRAQDPQTIRKWDISSDSDKVRSRVENWPECDEYKSADRCKVTIYLGAEPLDKDKAGPFLPRAHWDVHVKPFIFLNEQPRGEAAVVLRQSSPFLACTVSPNPGPATRDLSSNIGTLLSDIAAAGAIGTAKNFVARNATRGNLFLMQQKRPSANSDLNSIEEQLKKIDTELNGEGTPYKLFRAAFDNDWKYGFLGESEAVKAVQDLREKSAAALAAPEPDFVKLYAILTKLNVELQPFVLNPPDSDRARVSNDADLLQKLLAEVTPPDEAKKDEQATRKQVRKIYELVWSLGDLDPQHSHLTEQVLPMAYFSGKQVTETVSCKDANSGDSAFHDIIFTAYYEGLPHFDVSIGALFSLLGGRQVGTNSDALTSAQQTACPQAAAGSAQASCAPNVVLGNTTRSSYQLMPGVFLEWRWKNFVPPWVRNGSPVHKLGYLWSFGPAVGLAINPNNGTAQAEFFEGFSLGIQRFSIMAGIHQGRYQQFSGGYASGQVFPSSAAVAPPTERLWATHPAFGIAYRIPIR